MNGEIIGRRLRAAREAQNLSLEQISQATYIRVHHLRSMEEGAFDNLTSKTQARGFLRTVASYLDIDPEPLLAELDQPGSLAKLEAHTEDHQEIATETGIPSRLQPADLQPQLSESGIEQKKAVKKRRPIIQQNAARQPDEVQGIFEDIGDQLRNRRELLGLTIEDVERHTRLRIHYLHALESGKIEWLPSPVQGRGMLHNYAIFLGLNPEPLLLQFAEGLQTSLALRQGRPLLNTTETEGDMNRLATGQPGRPSYKPVHLLRRLFSIELLTVILIAVFLISFAIWGAFRIMEMLKPEQTLSTAPSIADVLLATETPQPIQTNTSTPDNPGNLAGQAGLSEAETPEQAIVPGSNVQLYLTIHQRALLQIIVDGEQEFLGRVMPGTAYSFNGKNQIELTTSNGAAVQVFYNGEDQGLLGLFGQVVYRIYSTQGILTPTPTITLTPTPTEIPTATPEPTRTISPDLPEAPTVPALP